MIFDTHAHYDSRKFNEDREELMNQLVQEGIGRIVDIGADIESTRKAMELAKKYDFVYAAAGVHPSEVDCLDERSFQWLTWTVEQSVEEKGKIVAVGEIGLDYYWEKDDDRRNRQKYWFECQMELARSTGLPVVIHSREAAKDTWDMMKGLKCEDIGFCTFISCICNIFNIITNQHPNTGNRLNIKITVNIIQQILGSYSIFRFFFNINTFYLSHHVPPFFIFKTVAILSLILYHC